jgi:hypothetical protein
VSGQIAPGIADCRSGERGGEPTKEIFKKIEQQWKKRM